MTALPIYAGASVWVSSGALGPDQRTRLVEADADAVTFRIIGPDLTDLEAGVAMAWDPDRQLFVGRWDTPADMPGEYTAEVVWDALGGATLINVADFTVEPRLGG